MWGEILAVATSLMWAASTVLSAEALKKVDPIRSNTIKTLSSALLMFPIAFAAGEMNNLSEVSLYGLFLVIAAALVGFGIGDTLFLKSMTLIGVSRAYTSAYTYPLFTMIIAVTFLQEPFSLEALIGTILIVSSVILILTDSDGHQGEKNLKGFLMALGTSLTWAVGIILVALGVKEMGVILANALRYPVLFFFLLAVSKPRKPWNIDKRSLLVLSASGALGMVIGGITFLYSLNIIGASRATPLSASSPVWAAIMSSLFLKEKVTPKILLAAVAVVIGIYFLTS